MVDFFDEIEDELREERMHELLKKYGGVLFAGALEHLFRRPVATTIRKTGPTCGKTVRALV